MILAGKNGAAFGIADHVLQTRNRQPLAHTRPLIDTLIRAGLESDGFNDLLDEIGDEHAPAGIPSNPGLLLGDGDSLIDVRGIVRFDLGTDSIFQRSDDLSPRRIVFRVR